MSTRQVLKKKLYLKNINKKIDNNNINNNNTMLILSKNLRETQFDPESETIEDVKESLIYCFNNGLDMIDSCMDDRSTFFSTIEVIDCLLLKMRNLIVLINECGFNCTNIVKNKIRDKIIKNKITFKHNIKLNKKNKTKKEFLELKYFTSFCRYYEYKLILLDLFSNTIIFKIFCEEIKNVIVDLCEHSYYISTVYDEKKEISDILNKLINTKKKCNQNFDQIIITKTL